LIWIGSNQFHDAKILNQKLLVKDQGSNILAFFSQTDDEVTGSPKQIKMVLKLSSSSQKKLFKGLI